MYKDLYSIPAYVVGTALNDRELTSTSSGESSSVTGASENNQLPANKVLRRKISFNLRLMLLLQ